MGISTIPILSMSSKEKGNKVKRGGKRGKNLYNYELMNNCFRIMSTSSLFPRLNHDIINQETKKYLQFILDNIKKVSIII